MKTIKRLSILPLGGLVFLLSESLASEDSENLYWIDLYDAEDGPDGYYACISDIFTYSDDDCPFIGDPLWSNAASVDICKERCNEMNENWNRDQDPTPPCTSIAWDAIASECAPRQCLQFPVIIAEDSSTHEEMAEKYDRYKENIDTLPIQDYFLNFFDPSGDSKCLPGETFRRVTEQEEYQKPGSYVCEYDGPYEYYWTGTDLPNPNADDPDVRESLPLDYFWDENAPTFDGCWDGMDDAMMKEEYLTYSFAIRLDYEWQQHYFEYEKSFIRHGYGDGVENSFKIELDKASWLFREQFGVHVKAGLVALQNSDGSWPGNPWRLGDAGVITFTGAYSGVAEGVGHLCSSFELTVGDAVFKENGDNPDFPLYNVEIAATLAHELGHHMGHGHNPVYMPDIMVGGGDPSYRRCVDPVYPDERRVCTYRSFLSFTEAGPRQNYMTSMCDHIRSEQAQCCAVVESLDTSSTSASILSPPSPSSCGLGGTSLCPGGGDCKYKGGGLDWDWFAGCNEAGYENIMPREHGDQSYIAGRPMLSQESKEACMDALADMQSIGINIRFDPDPCTIYLLDKPPGCFITCENGEMVGYFNANAFQYMENKFYDAEALCVKSEIPTPAPMSDAPTEEPTVKPSMSDAPTEEPTVEPSISDAPTEEPTVEPLMSDAPTKKVPCFSGNMEVVVQGKGLVPMEALQVGDYVKINNGEVFEQVYAFGHRVPQKYTEFVQLHTSLETPPLEMTGEHLVFVHGKTNPVRADSIKVGDVLQAEGNNAVVEKIEFVTRNGIYNPLTSSGTIQVNGITASNYISFQKENIEYVGFQGGIEIMSIHDAAHIVMTPYRFYCTTLAICVIDDANSFMPLYVSMGIELIEWSKQQYILVLVSILMAFAVSMILAYLLSGSSIFQMKCAISHITTIGVILNKELEMKKEN